VRRAAKDDERREEGVMKPELLYELAMLFDKEAESIAQPYAWHPRPRMSAEEVREVERLRVTGTRLYQRAVRARYERGDDTTARWVLFGEEREAS
jgi:hypothetical protein